MWTPTNIIALVASAGAILTPITALLLTYRGFSSIEDRLKVIEADLKQFYKDIYQLKIKTGLEK